MQIRDVVGRNSLAGSARGLLSPNLGNGPIWSVVWQESVKI
ncbi:TPA: hypothetical protein ACGPXR_000282 [Escherichia coli]|nr:hypothetical protein [Escherichia coli]EYE36243.1 hypothetical protein AB38_2603 [Escherichia coli 1-110-08_S1_C2]